jgi:hypothetical protein
MAQQSAPATPPAAAAEETQSPAPAGSFAYFVNLKDGDTVTSPFKVIFGLSPTMGVAPAGTQQPNVGHHHLLVDTPLTADDMKQPLPVDDQHRHFGKGQTETTLTLPPGKHTLQLVLGDWTHIPFKPSVQSDVITVTVKTQDGAVSIPSKPSIAAHNAPAKHAETGHRKPAKKAVKLAKPRRHYS